jgi:hypothetical protein
MPGLAVFIIFLVPMPSHAQKCRQLLITGFRSERSISQEAFYSSDDMQGLPGGIMATITELDKRESAIWKRAFSEGNKEIFAIRFLAEDGEILFESNHVGTAITGPDLDWLLRILFSFREVTNASRLRTIEMVHTHQAPFLTIDWSNWARQIDFVFGSASRRARYSPADIRMALAAKATMERLNWKTAELRFEILFPRVYGQPSSESAIAKKSFILSPNISQANGDYELSASVAFALRMYGLTPGHN